MESEPWYQDAEEAKLLNAFFALVLTDRISPQESLTEKTS